MEHGTTYRSLALVVVAVSAGAASAPARISFSATSAIMTRSTKTGVILDTMISARRHGDGGFRRGASRSILMESTRIWRRRRARRRVRGGSVHPESAEHIEPQKTRTEEIRDGKTHEAQHRRRGNRCHQSVTGCQQTDDEVPKRARDQPPFDVLHGQRGVAPNGVELRPVLRL